MQHPDSSAAPAAGAADPGSVALGELTVHRLGFGAMRITGPGIWGAPADPREARAVLRRAVELGVNFIDTADSYGPEVSEQLIYEALHPYPPGLVIATKGGLTRPGPHRWIRNGHPEHLRAACEGSLSRLHLDRIDLYQLHAVDPAVPLADSLGTIGRLQQEGKIRHVGVSNVDLAQLRRAQALLPIVSVQNRYNVSERDSEPVLRYCLEQKLAFLPWAPLGGREGGAGRALAGIAAQHGVSENRVALAWLLQHSAVMLPIPGTSSRPHLEDNVAAASLRLTPAELLSLG